MSRRSQTVKVHRRDLLKQVEASHVNAMDAFRNREVEYERDLAQWKKDQLAYLYKAIDRVQSDDFDVDARGRLEGYAGRYNYAPEPPQDYNAVAISKGLGPAGDGCGGHHLGINRQRMD